MPGFKFQNFAMNISCTNLTIKTPIEMGKSVTDLYYYNKRNLTSFGFSCHARCAWERKYQKSQ